jgi:hypothetical protein
MRLLIALLALLGGGVLAAEHIPLPRPRPAQSMELQPFVDVAGPKFDTSAVRDSPTDCDQRLVTIAAIKLLPWLIGPEACGGHDMVELDAVLLQNHSRVTVEPAAVLRCAMAESFAAWVRDEVSGRIAVLGAALRGVQNYDSYECRSRNRLPGAKLSEHARGNAIDVRAFILADGRRIKLTDSTVAESLREELRDTACHRFTTVLGPGADSHHNGHIHLDNLERNHGYRICEWDVHEPSPSIEIASGHLRLPARLLLARSQPQDKLTVTVGPWAIASTYKADSFDSCTMSRSAGELGITFVRNQDGLLVILASANWKVDRGKAYSVRLVAGSRSVGAKAMAETKSVTIALADRRLYSQLRSANVLEVRGKGATLRVPLDESSMAFKRLEACFNKRQASKTNPFVRRKASESNPLVPPNRKP